MTRPVVIPYHPRAPFRLLHGRTQRWGIAVCHRRAGKTVAAINDLLRSAIRLERTDPPGRFAYIAPYYVQAKDVAWQYLRSFSAPIPGVQANEGELWVELPHNGARIRLYGADNPDRMRGIFLDGAVGDEMAQWHPAAWHEVVRPALADRQGWFLAIGTPAGDNAFREMWDRAQARPDEWFSMMLRASESGILPAAELEAMRLEMTPFAYAQELECSFDAPVEGAFYGEEMARASEEGRITRVPHDPFVRVHTAWDLGIADATAIWFIQQVGGEVRFVDYHEGTGRSLLDYATLLRDKQRECGYVYDTHYLPHDVAVRELTTGQSRRQTLAALGLDGGELGRRMHVAPDHGIDDGIAAAYRLLRRAWFDTERCDRGIRALKNYQREFDTRKRVFKRNPRHDEWSHGADALRYFAVCYDNRASSGKVRARDPYRDEGKKRSAGWMGG